MAEWKARILDFYFGLGERDRRVVNWGAPVILLLLIYLVLGRPLVDGYLQVANSHKSLRADLAWLTAQEEHLQRINSYCPMAIDPVAEDDFELVVTGQARRLGLEPSFGLTPGETLSVEIGAAGGNATLTLIRELACRGLVLTNLEITRGESDTGLVDAKLELSSL